jgi:hypothetical protein
MIDRENRKLGATTRRHEVVFVNSADMYKSASFHIAGRSCGRVDIINLGGVARLEIDAAETLAKTILMACREAREAQAEVEAAK